VLLLACFANGIRLSAKRDYESMGSRAWDRAERNLMKSWEQEGKVRKSWEPKRKRLCVEDKSDSGP